MHRGDALAQWPLSHEKHTKAFGEVTHFPELLHLTFCTLPTGAQCSSWYTEMQLEGDVCFCMACRLGRAAELHATVVHPSNA
jgi:hypothetical protein